MHIRKITLGIVAVVLLSAGWTFAQKVTYNFMPGIDFTHYKTYKWQRIEKGEYPNQLLDEQIRRSIDMQLRSKGLMRDDNGIPELVVIYQAAVSQDKEWNSYSTGGGYWGWGGWGGWGGMGTTSVYSKTITTGSINVDIYDVLTKKQIWRGEVTKTIKAQKDPAKLQKNLDKAMAKLMKNFPPPQKN
jgi:hypothetical protein